MAVPRQQEIAIVLLLVVVFVSEIILGQISQWGYSQIPPNQQNPYNIYGPQTYNIPNPGDKDYRTFVYKGRRYGQLNSYYEGTPGDPRIRGQDDRFSYDRVRLYFILTAFCLKRLKVNNTHFHSTSLKKNEGGFM